jgi:hypothetical protein
MISSVTEFQQGIEGGEWDVDRGTRIVGAASPVHAVASGGSSAVCDGRLVVNTGNTWPPDEGACPRCVANVGGS